GSKDAVVVEGLAVVDAGVLRAAIGVMDQLDIGAGAALAERHLESVEDEIGAHVRGELPADDLAAVRVDHEREEDEPFPAAQVGQIGDPELVRLGRREVALDEIGPPASGRIGLGCPPGLAAPLRTLDASRAHQPLHAAARYLLAGAPQRLPHPPVAVGVVVGRVQLTDPAEQPLILDHTERPLAARALVVGGHRHAQGLADRLDPEAATMLVDVAAHLGRSGSSSLAKNTLAAFKISFARRSSKFSCRKRLISSRSSLVGRSGLKPSSASSWRTRFRSTSELMPRSAAMRTIGRPLSSANRTPRSSSSSGYFLGLDMTAEDLLSPGRNPGVEVPAKPGPAHSSRATSH